MQVAEILNWCVALLPVLVLVALFMWLDAFKLMTLWETLALLLAGGLAAIAAYPLSGIFLDTLPIGFSNYSRFVAPWIEEALKSIVIVSLFRFNRIGFKIDAVISGFAVGAGFAVAENIFYLWRFPEIAMSAWLVRGLGTAVMHGTTLALMAAIAHELAERETRDAAASYDFNPLWFVPGFFIAVAIHTGFNQFPDQPMLAMLGTMLLAPVTLMALFRFGATEAQNWLSVERETHRADYETLKQGRFPDGESGRRISELAARLGGTAAGTVREYCEVLTGLVLAAEDALARQAGDEQRVEIDARDGFDRLTRLERALGRTAFAALKPLLPFSRNDYWELSELKERLAKPTS